MDLKHMPSRQIPPSAKKKKEHDDNSAITPVKPKKLPKANLHFLSRNSVKRIVPLMEIPTSYYELQIEIARYMPRCKEMVIVRNSDKQIVTSKNFQPSPVYYVNEIHTNTTPEHIPVQNLKWEFESYHGKPSDWVDLSQLRVAVTDEEKSAREIEAAAEDDLFSKAI